MPDRDVYDRNIERGWQTAARRVYEGDEDTLILASLLRALGLALKDGGCPGIDTIASIVATTVGSADPRGGRKEAVAQLERVRRLTGTSRTELAVDCARRILSDPDALFSELADRIDPERAKLIVAEAILVEMAKLKISCHGLMHEMVEKEHKPIGLVLARRQHALDLLAQSPQITKLAREVLRCPEGQTVKVPRVKTPKPAQEDLVYMAISS